ncbi:MAG: endonuclease domain-containing protein [Bacteroidetes bacterium]|nr:endonuclease domain-containing protein [Bacteroidota bacterium]MBU1719116.1 endonuclease domain-containing protein [Bacteroidota bacterium]
MASELHDLPHLRTIRRELRSNMTPAERVLWNVLKEKGLKGRKFRRQHSIGNYVADFYCPSEKLVVELDGQHHYIPEGIENDKIRDQDITVLGIQVLRFENKEVLESLTEVLKKIKATFSEK